MATKRQPLVSVIVVTYNSSRTVVETLDSVARQSYHNIELVVTDDHSTDNTRDVINRWVAENGDRFIGVVKVYSDINTGPASNANRGMISSHGQFIKGMSGDDCLVENAIERYVDFLLTTGNHFCISNVELFPDVGIEVPEEKIISYKNCFEQCKESREQKLKRLAYEYVLLSPGYFYSREAYDKSGGFDNRFPFSEEVPFAMRILKAGYDMVAMDEKLVLYRYSGDSLSQHHGKKLGNRKWFSDNRRIYYHYQMPELLKSFRLVHAYSKMIDYEQTNLMYYNGIIPQLGVGVLSILNPYTYYRFIRKIIS